MSLLSDLIDKKITEEEAAKVATDNEKSSQNY